MLAIIAAAWAVRDGNDGWAFTATMIAMAMTVVSIFVDLYPNVMVSSTNEDFNLTVADTASSAYSLRVMSIVAVVLFPVVLLYQCWNYYVFRGRVMAPAADTTTSPKPPGSVRTIAAPGPAGDGSTSG